MSIKTARLVPVTPPGITILENTKALGMTQAEMAARMGRPLKTVNEIIKGKAAITPETAIQLEHVIGIPASFWLAREARYREYLAKKAEKRTLQKSKEWLEHFPIAAMVKYGWLDKVEGDEAEQAGVLLDFLGVAGPRFWETILEPYAAYRSSPVCKSEPGALACWLRKGEIEAAKTPCRPYDRRIFIESLTALRGLTREALAVFVPKVRELCAQAGVAVVFVRELPGTRAFGVARWLAPGKALIQLSSRYKSDDQLWFSLFHEAGHLLHDGKKEAFLECDDREEDRESRTNAFAADFLIPPRVYEVFCSEIAERHGGHIGMALVNDFAASLGIAPGIIVGRLQHEDRLPKNFLNKLKRYYDWPAGLIH